MTKDKSFFWGNDRDRLTEELFNLESSEFVKEVKKLLPDMEPNNMTRKYLLYLYKKGENVFLVEKLREKKNLMKAFLAEDVMGVHSGSDPEQKTYDIEECLITKMSIITERIKNEIESR
jgi:hypothetical protein